MASSPTPKSNVWAPKAANQKVIGGTPSSKFQPRPKRTVKEVAADRTATSDTFLESDGTYQVRVYSQTVNYRNAQGAWEPINDALVPAATTGYALTNGANQYSALFPSNLASSPVRESSGGSRVAFSLRGAHGSPVASGDTASYANALPGLTLSYTAEPDGVKESLMATSPAALDQMTFDVTVSGGLTPEAQPGGSVRFVNSSGSTVFSFAAPSATDAAQRTTPVSLALTREAGGYQATLKVPSSFVSSAAYPVTVDPSTIFSQGYDPSYDCSIIGIKREHELLQ